MQLSVREATQRDQQRLANLIHFEVYVHRHLDWRQPLDWIGHRPFLVVERGEKLIGALACPLDKPEIPWIRLFAATNLEPLGEVWQLLWDASRQELIRLENPHAAAIAMQGWFKNLLNSSGFVHTNDVVVLMWEAGAAPSPPKEISGSIRVMTPKDLEIVNQLDYAAFAPEWRNSPDALKLAFQQAALATVVVDGQDVIGYQISTASLSSGHLARLAVHPKVQNRGVGYALVFDMLDQFHKRGINQVTVNTQQDNLASMALYARAGFAQIGEHYPVYQYIPD